MEIPILAKITAKTGVLDALHNSVRTSGQGSPMLTPGQEVRGDVLARLEDSSYLVKVAGEVFNMEIPIPLETGSSIQLTFLCSQPRPAFTMQSSSHDATSVNLSDAATLLTRSFTTDEAAKPDASQLSHRILLQGGTAADPPVLATALRNAVTFSGLFYESHLLQWYLGEIPFSEILQEARSGPQYRIRRDQVRKDAITSDETGVEAEETENNMVAALLSENESADASSVFSLKAQTELVRDQLNLLMSGTFAWHGEVMTGHEMEWLVERDPDGADTDGPPSWRTSISINLPNLGLVCATLTLAREGIEGIVRSKLPETATILRKEIGILEERLEGAGIRLNEMVIEIGE